MEDINHKLGSTSQPCPKPNENKTENKTKVNRYRKGGSAGSKGVEYQISLIAMVMLNAMKNVLSEWKLSTENDAAGKFDDIVVEWTQGAVLLQSKHKENSKKRITLEELTSTNSKADDFSLPKYFLSYMSIKDKFNIRNLILCTNAAVQERALGFLNHITTNNESLLHYEDGEISFYTLKDTIIPVLQEKTILYYDQNFKNKGIQKSVITKENLLDFLTRLQLFFSYPSQTDLDKIIEQFLNLTTCCSNSQGQITQREMYPKLMYWFQQKDGIYFTDFLAKAMFAEIWTNKYREKLKLYKVSLQKINLNFQHSKQIFYVTPSHGNLLQAIKIDYAVQKEKILFVNPDDDIDTQKLIFEAFSLPQYDFLIINQLKVKEESVIEEMCAKLRDILSDKKYKKVILMTDDVFSSCLRHKIDYEIVDGSVTFADLSKDFQGKLVKKKSIIFQGRAVCLEELLVGGSTEDYVKATDQKILENIITGKVKVGVQPSDVDENIAPFYINRTFITPTGNIHEKDIYDVKENVVLISNSAGVGKTTVLSKLATNIKQRNPHLWVIKMALTEYTQLLKKLKDSGDPISITKLLNSKHSTELMNHLESFVFSIEKKVVLMFDGVDEISPDYTELIHSLLTQCLQATNLAKLFITTRPHMVKELKKIMKVDPFELKPFTEQNQVDFLTSYWSHKLEIARQNKEKCEKYAMSLIDRMSSWTQEHRYGEDKFTAMALHLRMLAEIFQESISLTKLPEWESCKEYLETVNEEPKLPENIEIKELYKLFIDRKRYIYIQKANPNWNSEANTALVTLFNLSLAHHRRLALEVILSEEDRQLFSCYQEISTVTNESVLNIGIVQSSSDSFYFIHRTFAEYFVAESLVSELKLQSRNPNIKFQEFFIDSFLQSFEYEIIRAFLDSFLKDVADSIPSNIFKTYQSESTSFSLLLVDYWIINLLASENCVAILQLILDCVDFKFIKGETHFPRLFADIFVKDLHDEPNKLKNLRKIVRNDHAVNTLNVLKFMLQDMGLEVRNRIEKTPLLIAAARGHSRMVRFLVHHGAKINSTDRDGSTALHLAAENGNTNIIKYLVQHGAEVNSRSLNGYTPLHISVAKSDLESVKYLVESGADVTVSDNRDRSALHFAVMGKHVYPADFLRGRNEEHYDRSNHSPVHVTVGKRQEDIIKYLVKHDRNINVKDEDGSTPLHYAARNSHLNTVKLLRELGGDSNIRNNRGQIALHLAAEEGHLDNVKYLVSTEVVDFQDRNGYTPMLLAAFRGHIDIVKFLHQQNAKIYIRNRRRKTLLHALAESGCIDEDLKKSLSDVVNIRDHTGRTALHMTAEKGHTDAVYSLCRMGADLKITDNRGETALHLAAKQGQRRTMEALHSFGADLDIRGESGRTALHLAVACKLVGVVTALLKWGADLNISDSCGRTALYLAAASEHWSMLKHLIEAGADLNIPDDRGETALRSAAASGRLDLVKYLHEAGADLNVKDIVGVTALHSVASSGRMKLVEYLVEAGADLNVADNNGETALHSAASCGHLDVVKFLLEAGTDLNIIDDRGRTALKSAAACGRRDVVKYLRKAGKNLTVKDEDRGTSRQLIVFKRRHQNCRLL